jgi:hypothetical protein
MVRHERFYASSKSNLRQFWRPSKPLEQVHFTSINRMYRIRCGSNNGFRVILCILLIDV